MKGNNMEIIATPHNAKERADELGLPLHELLQQDMFILIHYGMYPVEKPTDEEPAEREGEELPF
jgi:hypothetical protein